MSKLRLQPKEEILYVARVHWLIVTLNGIAHAIIGVLPIVLYVSLKASLFASIPQNTHYLILSGCIIFFTILWIHYFFVWTDYRLDLWLITNQRLIDIDQNGMFSRKISILHLEQVQDINVNTKGFINTILNVGDINVQTAAQQREFIMNRIDNPMRVQNLLAELVRKILNSDNNPNRNHPKPKIAHP